MPNLISQMRNGASPQQMQQPQLDASIEKVRGMMQSLQMASNKEAMLKQMIQNNPQFAQIAAMMKMNPNGLEGVAKQMARQNGINLSELMSKLSQ